MRKIVCLMFAVLLLVGLSVTAFAQAAPVADLADVLLPEEEAELTSMLSAYGYGAVQILTVSSLDGEHEEDYAESYAEQNHIGVLMLVAIQERRWCITSSGAYEGAIDGDTIDLISAACVPHLKNDDYYGAFTVFAQRCGSYLENFDPESYDSAGADKEGMGGIGRFLICLVIGLAAGGMTAGIMAAKNKSVRPENNATEYVRPGSMEVTQSRDIFLYFHISRIPKPQNNHISGGGGSRSTRSGGF